MKTLQMKNFREQIKYVSIINIYMFVFYDVSTKIHRTIITHEKNTISIKIYQTRKKIQT